MIELTILEELILITQVNQKECDICHDWYFLDKRFTFQPNVCNGCYNLLMASMKLRNIANLNINSADYCCVIGVIGRSQAVHLL